MTCCSPSQAVAMDPLMKHPMRVAEVAAAVAVVAGVRAGVKAAAAVLSDQRAPSLRSAHLHGAPRQRRRRQKSPKDATKLTPKMRVKREFPVLSSTLAIPPI